MSKITEPQACVLRTMAEYDCQIRINQYGHVRYGAFEGCSMPYAAWRFPPLKRTLLALQRKGILESQGHEGWNQRFVLTPKGREIAKELQDESGASTGTTGGPAGSL